MKMVKSLLLGSAATFVAAAGAQAADLPMKAKAVEYVKVCSLYGAGYYYIPGTDTCIKIGGFVRFDTAWNGEVSGASPYVSRRYNDADANRYQWRTRFMLGIDTRSQTEYGTLRSYIRAGWQYTSGSVANGSQGDNSSAANSGFAAGRAKDGVVYTERAFIQFAGFTFGKTQSFFDVWAAGAVSSSNLWGYDDTGNGINLAAYTAMLGNGVSLSIAAEDPQAYRRMNIYQTGSGPFSFGSLSNLQGNGGFVSVSTARNSYGNTEVPDIVGTLRVDQAWGSAMVGGLVHQLRPTYNSTTLGNGVGTEAGGGPGVKWGWAVTAGADINLPWAKGDRFVVQGTYTEGVMGTVMGGLNNTAIGLANGSRAAIGYIVDANWESTVAGASLNLTTGWGVIGGVEHYWVPTLRSSLFGSYTQIRYSGDNVAGVNSATGVMCSGIQTTFTGITTCNPDLNLWNVGTRTVWTPVPNLDLSVEAVYSYVDQNNTGIITPGGAYGTQTRPSEDFGQWTFNFRVQRNFWP